MLVVASVVGYVLDRRFGAEGPNPTIDNLNRRIKAWWVMVALLGLAFAFGRAGMIVLFALASLAALREFITLTPTRKGDHVALAVAFWVSVTVVPTIDRMVVPAGIPGPATF